MQDNLTKHLPKDSWFRDYMSVWPTSEPPKSYILFSAMCMMGAALGRRVYVDMDIHRTFPMLNLLLIGPSGIGKSTALVDMALDHLIRPLPETTRPLVITGKTTKEPLHEDLLAHPHAILVASELANMFSKEKYQEGMIQYMTDLLDLRPTRVRTKSGGDKTIDFPAVTVTGGSTKEWLQDQLPSSAGAGGFLPRFLIVKEDHKAQRVADPNRVLSIQQKHELACKREHMFYEFSRLLKFVEGRVEFADWDASDTYSLWYESYMPETGNLSPFAARAGAHVIRLALLSAISCRRGEILSEDIRAGIALHEYCQKKLQEVVVPMTPQGKMLQKVLDCIGEDEVSETQICRAMRNYCASQDVVKILSSLMSSKDVIYEEGRYRRLIY